ncbi:MAG TPA: hypothetical protein VGG06_00480 [Thermoanaerobaculia bacterium]
MPMNPYNWQSHHPRVEIPRAEAGEVTETLLRGGSAVALGGRGMGKSVFLRQLKEELERSSDLRALLVAGPPMELSARACLGQLAAVLDVPAAGVRGSSQLLEAYFAGDVPGRLVLLFDEFDRYADVRGPASAGRAFFNDLELTRRDLDGLGVLAAGSLAVFTFRDSLGSGFLSQADRLVLRPFDREQVAALAAPLLARQTPSSAEVLDALYLAGGGHPALTTYGLGALWSLASPTERDVAGLFLEFQDKNRDFLLDFQLSFADPRLSEAPQRVWDLVRRSDGEVSQADLLAACSVAGDLWLDAADVLDLLQAAGLVRVAGSKRGNPVLVSPIASILTLPTVASPAPGLRQRLRGDLLALLSRLHASSADFFRPGAGGEGKRLVPESVFAGFLAMGFELLGWKVEREAQSVAGRTDVRLSRNGSRERAVVEVKIWGRHDYQEVHRQVASYWSADTVAGAVVMLTDKEIPDWPETYERKCLDQAASPVVLELPVESQVQAAWITTGKTADGVTMDVDHLLLRLARGRS